MKRTLLTVLFSLATALVGAQASAQYNLGVRAPTVPDADLVSLAGVGAIVYDVQANAFRGLDKNGEWQTFAQPSTDRVERIRFGGTTDFTSCTSAPCTIHSQSGSWVTSVGIDGSLYYVLNIAAGTFSERPTCTCVAQDAGTTQVSCDVFPGGDETTIKIGTIGIISHTYAPGYVEAICVGPK